PAKTKTHRVILRHIRPSDAQISPGGWPQNGQCFNQTMACTTASNAKLFMVFSSVTSRILRVGLLASVMAAMCCRSAAGDLKINLPKRSRLTPVQQLNRDGVKEARK